jgi:hypothetical protein
MKDSPDEPYIPDLSGVSICIATPSHDGKYEGRFMSALHRTVLEIQRLGGKGDFFQFCYCADVSLARAKVFGHFYRSKHTHLMMIDADMGWMPEDVVRMVLLDREFIAAAGPKKQYPLKFAANFTDDKGNPIPVIEEVGTGIASVNEIGLAFALIKRSLADKMVAAYPELQFDGDGKDVEYALFDPFIINRRKLGEDFAFCRRWQKIGGKIDLLPSVRLSHTGAHTWAGALADAFEGPGWSVSEPSQRENLNHSVEKVEN